MPGKKTASKSATKRPAARAKPPAAKKTAPKSNASRKTVKAPKTRGQAAKKPPAKGRAQKTAAAASTRKPAASTGFDPDKRRQAIASAAERRRKAVATARFAPKPVILKREPGPAERHRFSVGDDVRVVSTAGMWFKHGIDYKVTAALPPAGGKMQYRIKNESEPFERVVIESQLTTSPHRSI